MYNNSSLIEADDSVLLVIDVQSAFLNKLEPQHQTSLLDRLGWVIEVAKWSGIPLVVTAEDVNKLGSCVPQVQQLLPGHIKTYDKMTFGLTGDKKIMRAIETTRRRTCVIIGLETDVCVAQSALGLLSAGYRVVVLSDATASPDNDHQSGLDRIRDAGGIVTSVKGLFYEWLRTVHKVELFHQDETTPDPPEDLVL